MNQKFVLWEINIVQVKNGIDKNTWEYHKVITLQHENNSKLNEKSHVLEGT
jgi:hypothetical protein